ncbi:MAG: HD domain-containing protein [Mogibacterium sp.]|nr:HD domain-containing protein [Mogibacterium sp.]
MIKINAVFFLIGQFIFLPLFLYTTRKAFKPKMTFLGYIGYILISPMAVYIISILLYSIVWAAFGHKYPVLYNLSLFSDVYALLISFIFAFIYAQTCKAEYRSFVMFVYICFYMIGMVFSITYNDVITSFICSAVAPAVTGILMFPFFIRPVISISNAADRFRWQMLILPITAEALLVLRFFINILSQSSPIMKSYDWFFQIYTTLFGYIILVCLFGCIWVTTKDIQQIEIIEDENEKNNRLTLDMLTALVGTIEAKDQYTNGHSNRVANYSKQLAEKLGYSESGAENIYRIALLHDIGKIAIPDYILKKDGMLTKREYETIRSHPLKGAEILKEIQEFPDLYLGALYHHERWDGKGYPYGIKGDEIPEVASIISVADAYDAMTSERSYRAAFTTKKARREIEKGSGTQFSPDVSKVMLDIIDEFSYLEDSK